MTESEQHTQGPENPPDSPIGGEDVTIREEERGVKIPVEAPVSRDVLQRLRVFAHMAGGAMFSRLRQKAHIWAVSWQDDIYTDGDNEARLRAAVETLVIAVQRSRAETATGAEFSEPWK